MSEQIVNAHCAICGNGYHVCDSCSEEKAFMPWRTVVDTIEHYKIYTALHGYTLTKDAKKANDELSKCDLSNVETFLPEIRAAIKDIQSKCVKKQVKLVKKEIDDFTTINNE